MNNYYFEKLKPFINDFILSDGENIFISFKNNWTIDTSCDNIYLLHSLFYNEEIFKIFDKVRRNENDIQYFMDFLYLLTICTSEERQAIMEACEFCTFWFDSRYRLIIILNNFQIKLVKREDVQDLIILLPVLRSIFFIKKIK